MLLTLTNQPSELTCKAIVFAIDQYWLALPVSVIFRVTQCSSELRESIQRGDLIFLDDRALTPLHLHPLLKRFSSSEETSTDDGLSSLPLNPCLVIAQLHNHLYGILVDQPPALVEIDFANIHPLSTAYQQSMGQMTSQVAILSPSHQMSKVFLLNLNTLI